MLNIDQKIQQFTYPVRESSYTYHIQKNRRYNQPTVLSCGYQQCLPTYRVRRQAFKPFVMEYVTQGSGYIFVEGKKKDLHPGMMFTYGGGEPHEYGANPDDPMTKIHVAFAGKGSKALLRQSAGAITNAFGFTAPNEMHDVFETLLREAASINRNRFDTLNMYLKIALLKIEVLKSHKKRESVSAGIYWKAKLAIESQCIQLKSAKEVATELGISFPHLCRLFKRHSGTSPHTYLLQLKLNQAAQLLETTQRSIKEIAYELNFGDPYHFSRTFKKQFGVSPRHFRNEGF